MVKIRTYPDPVLREAAAEVTLSDILDPLFGNTIEEMRLTLKNEDRGAALAANQVGIARQIFVIKPSLAAASGAPEVIINPIIVRSGSLLVTETEGCLSFPGLNVDVTRPKKVEVEFMTPLWEKKKLNLSGFISRVFQHEMDHLNGVLFIDHTKKGA